MKQIFISLMLLQSLAFGQGNKKPTGQVAATNVTPATVQAAPEPTVSTQPATEQTAETKNGLKGKRQAILAHGGYLASSMNYGYFYTESIAGKKGGDEARFTREATGLGGGLNFLMTTPIAGILYGGFDAGISLYSIQKYQIPAVTNVSQFEGRLYGDGLLGIALSENFGLYAGAGVQTYYISPLKVDDKRTDPSYGSTFGIFGVNVIAGLHVILGRIVINPSFMADLALIGTADKDTLFAGTGFGTRKAGDIFQARFSIGYAFQ